MNARPIIKQFLPPLFLDIFRPIRAKFLLVLFKLKLALSNQSKDYQFTTDYVSVYAPTWVKFLRPLQGRPNLKMLEIGSFEGKSTVWFLKNILTHTTSSILCIDSFARPGGEFRFDHNIKVTGDGTKVNKKKGPSEFVLPSLSGELFDIIYIDGCHKALNVLFDLISSWLLLKPGGIIILDDYLWEMDRPINDRPQWAIDLFLSLNLEEIDVLHKNYQVIFKKREMTFLEAEKPTPNRSVSYK